MLESMERLTTGAGRKEDFKCDLYGVDACELANLKQHMGGWCGLNLFKCDPCGIRLSSRKTIKRHMETNHGSSSKCMFCEHCGIVVKSLRSLKLHELRVYKCCFCKDAMKINVKIKKHMISFYEDFEKESAVGTEAAKVVLPLAMIRIDEPRAHDLLIVLPICARGRVVRRVGARNLVMERLATKGEMDAVLRRIKCGSCGVETHKPANLKDRKGGWCGIKFFQCGPCGPVAKVIIQLKRHVETNHESSSQCREWYAKK